MMRKFDCNAKTTVIVYYRPTDMFCLNYFVCYVENCCLKEYVMKNSF